MAKPRITQTTPYNSPGHYFSGAENMGAIPKKSTPTEAPNRGGVG